MKEVSKTKKSNTLKESKTMNPTLVSGFEDIITHIKQQEQRIMSLEEENKNVIRVLNLVRQDKEKLEEENKKLKGKYEEGLKHVLTLTDEKTQLEEELESYKEELSDAHYQYELLKDENKQLKVIVDNETAQNRMLEKKLKEQKQSDFWENHQLRKENIKLKQDDPVEKEFKDAMEDLEKKVKELGGWSPTSSKQPVQDQ